MKQYILAIGCVAVTLLLLAAAALLYDGAWLFFHLGGS